MASPKLILASASPRRQSLLAAAGIIFEVVVSHFDEIRFDHEDAVTYAVRMARSKALEVSRRQPQALVLGADTVVELDGEILLKPDDAAHARQMLRALSGHTHTVITAFCVARAAVVLESAPITARVTFRTLSASEIDAYVATGEPLDKAGSYGIQRDAAGFIMHVEGARDTVMGLPVAEALAALRRQGLDAA